MCAEYLIKNYFFLILFMCVHDRKVCVETQFPISNHKVAIFSKSSRPNCVKAKKVLHKCEIKEGISWINLQNLQPIGYNK